MIEMAGGQLYHGDCLEVMQDIPDDSIDMILADLPYKLTKCSWDITISLKPLWGHYERVIKNKGAIVLTSQQPFTTDLINSNRRLFRYELIWEKSRVGNFLNASKMPLKCHENVLIFAKESPVYNPQKWRISERFIDRRKTFSTPKRKSDTCYDGTFLDGGYRVKDTGWRNPLSIISIPTIWQKDMHSTQKPVELFEYLIKTYTYPGDTVLDNVIGLGTTAVAAFKTQRNWIGIEKDPKIFEKCRKRIERDTRQQILLSA
jgi:site-specific DNA-methyltransferase (adenine-specific)